MPFFVRLPLPGPFGYSKQIGGRRKRRSTRRVSAPAGQRRSVQENLAEIRRLNAQRQALKASDPALYRKKLIIWGVVVFVVVLIALL